MSTVFTTPSISEYTDAAICYGLVECLLRGAPDSSLEVYSRGAVDEVYFDLELRTAQEAIKEGFRDALEEILEGVAAAQRLSWVYAAVGGGLQPKDGDVRAGTAHLKEVLHDLSLQNSEGISRFLQEISARLHHCRGKWTSLALVPEWGRQEKGFFASPNRSSKLCQWCYALAWVGLHNFALFTRHQSENNQDRSCSVALMIPGPSEKPYVKEELLSVRELGTKYQRERPLETPPPSYAFLLWVLSCGETILPLMLSRRSFLASVMRFDRTGRAPQYSVAIRSFQVAPVWRLLQFVAEAKRRTSRFHSLINTLIREDRGANTDTAQQLAESVLFADSDGLYRALRSIRSIAQQKNIRLESGVIDAAFEAIS